MQDMDDREFFLPSVDTDQSSTLDGHKEIESLLYSAMNKFNKLLQTSKLVSPTEIMTRTEADHHEYAASDLTICNGCKDLASCTHHFHLYSDSLQEPFQKSMMANLNKASMQIKKDGIPVMAHS